MRFNMHPKYVARRQAIALMTLALLTLGVGFGTGFFTLDMLDEASAREQALRGY